jgi:hypothetical protein
MMMSKEGRERSQTLLIKSPHYPWEQIPIFNQQTHTCLKMRRRTENRSPFVFQI